MAFIIDGHQDLAYNGLSFNRNLVLSAAQTREEERNSLTPQRNGHTLLGWPDYQRGQVALIFGTLFLSPLRYRSGSWETQIYGDPNQAYDLYERQVSFYQRLCGDHPDLFRLVLNRQDLQEVLRPWRDQPAYLPLPRKPEDPETGEEDPHKTITHPVGIVILFEGAEGIRAPEDMQHWWERGVRIAGPVWAGTRFCGGTYEPGGFTSEGFALLEIMGELGYTLDISHMTEASALQALERYVGPVIASHANARALLKGSENERHLTDQAIHQLIERDGVIGVIPFNHFLLPGWKTTDDRSLVTLRTLAAHIDHICQIAGDDLHVGLGSDFDGGFGWPSVPYEIDTIADLQKLGQVLADYGYSESSCANILGENWNRCLERSLPGS